MKYQACAMDKENSNSQENVMYCYIIAHHIFISPKEIVFMEMKYG